MFEIMNIFRLFSFLSDCSRSMATGNANTDEQCQTTATLPKPHDWRQFSDSDEDEIDEHEFFDAHDTDIAVPSTKLNTNDNDLLHERLNQHLSTETKVKDKSPGLIRQLYLFIVEYDCHSYYLEDPYFIDEDLLIEREAMLTDDDKAVNYVVVNNNLTRDSLQIQETSS
jgi:hypothetical protein